MMDNIIPPTIDVRLDLPENKEVYNAHSPVSTSVIIHDSPYPYNFNVDDEIPVLPRLPSTPFISAKVVGHSSSR